MNESISGREIPKLFSSGLDRDNMNLGEELLTWCLEHSSVNKDGRRTRLPGHIFLRNRLARCLTNVEAFVLQAADLEEVTSLFARFLRSPRVQGANFQEQTSMCTKFLEFIFHPWGATNVSAPSSCLSGIVNYDRYESPYWRGLAAKEIQVAWRYRKKRLSCADSSGSPNYRHSI